MKKFIITLIFISANLMIFAQELPTFQSPEAAALGIIGNIPVSYHTGRANISIPLMEINSSGYTMPITLSYNSGGLLPDMHPTWVGQNWNLEVGGLITRTVRGFPDEINLQKLHYPFGTDYDMEVEPYTVPGAHPCIAPVKVKGFLYNSNYTKPYGTYYWDSSDNYNELYTPFNSIIDLYCNSNSSYSVGGGCYGVSYFSDPESDEYFISVNGFSGKMYIGKNGKFQVAGHPEIKVEKSTVNVIIDKILPAANSFIITMSDGIKYTFGIPSATASNTYIETSATSGQESANRNQCGLVTSWLLSSIILPNNETINFSYKLRVYDKNYTYSYLQGGTTETLYGQPIDCKQGETESYQDIGHCYIDSIEGRNFVLNFYSSKANDKPIKNHSYYTGTNNSWAKLDYMILKDKQNQKIKRIDFSYNNNQFERLYLLSVTEEGKSPYLLDYNGSKSINYVKGGRDLWGYYNGYADNCYINVSIIDYDKEYFPDCRKTNLNLITQGILSKITYPIGGKVEFEFEANTYSKIFRMEVKPNNIFQYNPKIIDANSINYAGGTRIAKITYKNTNNQIEYIRKYDYKDENNTSLSSGILGVMPALTYSLKSLNSSDYISILNSESFTPSVLTNGSYVGYSQVTEKILDKDNNLQGYTVYKYTNFDTNPDSMPVVSAAPYYYRDFFKPNSKEEERGQLLSKTDFSFDNKPVRVENYQYVKIQRAGFRGLEVKPVPCSKLPYFTYSIYEISNNSFLPSKKEEIYYDKNGNETQKSVETYTYDNNNFVKTITTTNSNNQTLTTLNKYPADFSNTAPYNKMVQKNILNPVVQKITYLNGTNKVISGEYLNFSEYSTSAGKIYKPQSISNLLNDNSVTTTNYGSFWKQNMTFTYTDFGKILTAFNIKSGLSTVYLWGYNYQYPIIKIENATLNQIKNLVDEKYWKRAQGTLDNDDLHVVLYNGQYYVQMDVLRDVYNSYSNENQPVDLAVRFSGVQEIQNTEEFNQYVENLVLLPISNINFDENADAYFLLNGIKLINNKVTITSITRTDIDGLVPMELADPIQELGETLRTALPNAQVWTYTYKPLVGITSITDPRGVTTTFQYDEFGRLKNAKDSDLKLLQEYNYHYKQ